MRFRAEFKFLSASFALLIGLVVPVSAAVIDTTSGAAAPVASAAGPSAASSFFVHGAPQPLIVMALGALVVLIPVTRRALRAGARVSTASPIEPAQS